MVRQEEVRAMFDYDAATGILTRKQSRGNRAAGAVAGTEKCFHGHNRYYYLHIGERHYMAHQIVFLWMTGEMPTMVDHINRNGLDNRWTNLRAVGIRENALNRNRYENNTSGYKGVHFSKKQQKWVAYIDLDKKRTHLGYHNSAEGAARAYDQAAKVLFGEYAAPNLA